MKNVKRFTSALVMLFILGIVAIQAQSYKYIHIQGWTDATNAKLENFLNSTIGITTRKVAVFDCDGTLLGQVPYYLAEESLYAYAEKNYKGKTDKASKAKYALVNKMINEDATTRERDRVKFLSGLTPEEVENIGWECYQEKYRNKFYPQMRVLLANLRNYGFETWVISASPELLYQRICVEGLGFKPEHVIGVKSPVNMQGKVTDQITFPSPQDQGKAECVWTFIKEAPLFAAGNSRGDMEMMNTSIGLKLMLNPDAKKPNKAMGGVTAKQYWEKDPNCIIEYTRDVTDQSKDWQCKKLGVKVNATTDVSDPMVVAY